MRVTPISEIASLKDKETIMRVEGEITKVYEHASGGEGDKAWTRQNFYFKDSSGEIKGQAWNKQDLQPLTKKRVAITCHHGPKGYSGVYVDDNTYKEKTTRLLKLTQTAQIEQLNGDAKPPPTGRAGEIYDKGDHCRHEIERQPEQKCPIVKQIKQTLGQCSDGYKLVLAEAHALRIAHDMEFKDHPMSDDQFTKMCNMWSMKICNKVEELPVHPIDPPKTVSEEQINEMFPADKKIADNEDF